MKTIMQEVDDSSIEAQEIIEQIPAKAKELLLLCDRPQAKNVVAE